MQIPCKCGKKAVSRQHADIWLLGLLLLTGAALLLYVRLAPREGAVLEVRIDGKLSARYPLDDDADIVLEGRDQGTNHLIIRDGQAWFSEASCPDHLCMGMGRISKEGQSIICLPNRVSVEIACADDAYRGSGGGEMRDAGSGDPAKSGDDPAVDIVVGR